MEGQDIVHGHNDVKDWLLLLFNIQFIFVSILLRLWIQSSTYRLDNTIITLNVIADKCELDMLK